MASTVDSESTDPGSNPGRPNDKFFCYHAWTFIRVKLSAWILSLAAEKFMRSTRIYFFTVTHEMTKLRESKIFCAYVEFSQFNPSRIRDTKNTFMRHTHRNCWALVAQWIAHWTSNPEVAGSNPVKSECSNATFFWPLCVSARVAQSVEHWSNKPTVAGSIPVVSTYEYFFCRIVHV